MTAFSLIDVSHDDSMLSTCAYESLDLSIVQGKHSRDLGEVTEPLSETEVGSLSSLELVLTGDPFRHPGSPTRFKGASQLPHHPT